MFSRFFFSFRYRNITLFNIFRYRNITLFNIFRYRNITLCNIFRYRNITLLLYRISINHILLFDLQTLHFLVVQNVNIH